MKKVSVMFMAFGLTLSIATVTNAAVMYNNFVDCAENGVYSSVNGTYLPKNNTKATFAYASLYSTNLQGAEGDPASSTAAYLYSRETGDRVTNVVAADVCQVTENYPASTAQVEAEYSAQYVKTSYAVKNRTYKTVVKMTGGDRRANQRIYGHTIP